MLFWKEILAVVATLIGVIVLAVMGKRPRHEADWMEAFLIGWVIIGAVGTALALLRVPAFVP